MAVGILIITHDGIGPALLGTANLMLSDCPLEARLLNASTDSDTDQLEVDTQEMVDQLNEGDGVLILTDLAGSTPSNIAARIAEGRDDVRIISGVNLSMLLRLFNYPESGLDELADKALSGGRDGIARV